MTLPNPSKVFLKKPLGNPNYTTRYYNRIVPNTSDFQTILARGLKFTIDIQINALTDLNISLFTRDLEYDWSFRIKGNETGSNLQRELTKAGDRPVSNSMYIHKNVFIPKGTRLHIENLHICSEQETTLDLYINSNASGLGIDMEADIITNLVIEDVKVNASQNKDYDTY